MAHSVITEIGPIVSEFEEEKVIILFGPMAPVDLREICVIHEFKIQPTRSLVEGASITLGNHTYIIKVVGSEANKNFEELGHVSIYFKSNEDGLLPGAIEVEPAIFPQLNIGDTIHL